MSLMSFKVSRSERGVGLIEVLIALLVFTMGVLGMASMQVRAKRTSYDALQRSLATSLTRDIIERMRSNPDAGVLENTYEVNNLGGGSIANEPTPDCRSNSNPCTSAELASHDLWEWEQALDGASESVNGNNAGGLVSPRACIEHDAGVITVTIAWKGYDGKANPVAGNNCGTGLNLYEAGEKDRQVVIVNTYIEEV